MCSSLETSVSTDSQVDFAVVDYKDFSRRDLRSLMFNLLYAMESYEYTASLESIIDNFNRGFDLNIPLGSEVHTIVEAVINDRVQLDELYEQFLDNWRPDRISVCTRLILRLGVWELLNTDTEARIIINEAIELAKCFAEVDAYRFVNGLLDRMVKQGVFEAK